MIETQDTMSIDARSVLGKLFAAENITVVHDPSFPTASFDTDGRVLKLPDWVDVSRDVYVLFLAHEVGHALYTPSGEAVKKANSKISGRKSWNQLAHGYLNIVEDARIERLIKSKYPGVKIRFHNGYKELVKRGMFGDVSAKEVAKLSLIDRLNIYYKFGEQVFVPFTDDEKKWITEIDSMVTFDDAVDIARRLFEDQKPDVNENARGETADSDIGGVSVSDDDSEEDGDGENGTGFGDQSDESDDDSDTDENESGGMGSESDDDSDTDENESGGMGSESDDETDEDSDSNGSGSGSDDETDEDSDSNGSGSGSDDETDEDSGDESGETDSGDGDSDSDDETDEDSGDESGDGDGDGETDDGETDDGDSDTDSGNGAGSGNIDSNDIDELAPPAPKTSEAFDKAQESLRNNDTSSAINYFEVPDYSRFNLDKYVEDYKDILKRWRYKSNRLDGFNEDLHATVVNENKKKIAYLKKEYELKKRAEEMRKTTIHESGSLDMNKLHEYKFNENIFMKNMRMPSGKNHGMVFLVDWSGSMDDSIYDVLVQVVTLTTFARKAGIKFEVYSFSNVDAISTTDGINNLDYLSGDNTTLYPTNVILRNYLSSRMNNMEYAYVVNRLLNHFNRTSTYYWRHKGSVRDINTIPRKDALGGTPLGSALLLLHPLIDQYRKQYKIEFVSAMVLTDGAGADNLSTLSRAGRGYSSMYGSSAPSGDRVVIRNKSHYQVASATENDFGMLIKNLRVNLGINLIGLSLIDGQYNNKSEYSSAKYEGSSTAFENELNENGFVQLDDTAFTSYFKVPTQRYRSYMKNSDSDDGLAKFMKERVMLKIFIDMITKTELKKKG